MKIDVHSLEVKAEELQKVIEDEIYDGWSVVGFSPSRFDDITNFEPTRSAIGILSEIKTGQKVTHYLLVIKKEEL